MTLTEIPRDFIKIQRNLLQRTSSNINQLLAKNDRALAENVCHYYLDSPENIFIREVLNCINIQNISPWEASRSNRKNLK